MAAKRKKPEIGAGIGRQKSDSATLHRYSMFADKWVETGHGAKSAIYAGYEPNNAYKAACRLLKDERVQNMIAERRAKLMKNTDITAEAVLRRYWELANVDVNDIVEYRRYACRHCHGVDGHYQWVDENEYWVAYARAAETEGATLPTDEGGYGYTRQNAPNPECAQCDGVGDGATVVHDSRALTGAARALYDGIEETKQGIKIKLRDRDKHLDAVARMLGLFKENITVTNVTDDGSHEW